MGTSTDPICFSVVFELYFFYALECTITSLFTGNSVVLGTRESVPVARDRTFMTLTGSGFGLVKCFFLDFTRVRNKFLVRFLSLVLEVSESIDDKSDADMVDIVREDSVGLGGLFIKPSSMASS